MIRFFGLLVMFFLLVPQICIPQDANPNVELISSIDKLSKRDVSLVGSIDEEVQEQPFAAGIAGGFQRVMIPSMSLGSTREYRGDAEVLVSKNGDLVIASKEELPGVKVFKTGEEVLSLQAHIKEPFRTSKLVGDLSKLLDWIALGNAVESATEIQTRVKGKDTEFRVILDGSFIPSEIVSAVPAMPAGVIRIGANPMLPTITELAVTFKMNAAKEIVRLEYALQYNDPMKGLVFQGGAAGGIVQFKNKPAGEEDLGKLIVYEFDVVAKPSDKLSEFVKQARSMLQNRK
ncbi:MAG: hypothetical protein NTU79_08910 [Planctomycetota bacterium]|nr:hypothetical protein [Planctomycetota bacterium]